MGDDNRKGFFNDAPNYGTQTYNEEDRSLKRRLRALFAAVDERIPLMLDQGSLHITTRMSDTQFHQFSRLWAEGGSAEFIEAAGRLGPGSYMHVSNGSLGPGHGCDQVEAAITFRSAIRE